MPHRRLEDEVLQSAQDAVLNQPADGEAPLAAPAGGSPAWRRYTAENPVAASLAAMAVGALAAALLRNTLRKRRANRY